MPTFLYDRRLTLSMGLSDVEFMAAKVVDFCISVILQSLGIGGPLATQNATGKVARVALSHQSIGNGTMPSLHSLCSVKRDNQQHVKTIGALAQTELQLCDAQESTNT